MPTMHTQVLVVDGSKLFRELLANLMFRNGLETVQCADGASALRSCRERHYDLICIAYHLADISGEDLCKLLREQANQRHSRVILFTSEDNDALLKGALLAGATDIYNKNEFQAFQTYIQRFAESQRRFIVGNVLLIEDSPSQAAWLSSLLASRGLSVDAFPDAEQALLAFHDDDYDIVVTDVVLAGKLTGLNQVRAIRRLSGEKGAVPIFAVTAYDDVSRRIELFNVGINDYMAKPVHPEEMINRIANLIELHQARKKLNQERMVLQEMALLDPLTKLYNRAALNQLLPKALANAYRDRVPVSLAVMDVDHFKPINDNHGHQHGDRVLQELGEWLPGIFRDGDMIFRWGGEEFVIFLNNCRLQQAQALIEKQCQRLSQRRFANLEITASFGISTGEQCSHEISLEKLLEYADQALYEAKAAGRNRVVASTKKLCHHRDSADLA